MHVVPISLSLAQPVLELLAHLHSAPLAPQVQRLQDTIPAPVKPSLPSSPQLDGGNKTTLSTGLTVKS